MNTADTKLGSHFEPTSRKGGNRPVTPQELNSRQSVRILLPQTWQMTILWLMDPPQNTPHMTITEIPTMTGSYLPGLIPCTYCLVKLIIGRLASRSTPPPKCIMGYILWDVFGSHFGFCQEEVRIYFYF